MIINRSGILIRMAVADLRVMGRATQGVRLINIKEGDAIASVARVEIEEEPKEMESERRTIHEEKEINQDVSEEKDQNKPSIEV
jgi:DNA gyrase subunit A